MLLWGGLCFFDSCGYPACRHDSIPQQWTLSSGTEGHWCVPAACALQQSYRLCVCVCTIVTRCQQRMWPATFLGCCLPAFATAVSSATVHNLTWCQGRTAAYPTASAATPDVIPVVWQLRTHLHPPPAAKGQNSCCCSLSIPLMGAICPFVTTDTALSVVSHTHWHWTLDPCSLPSYVCHTCRGRTPRVSRQNILQSVHQSLWTSKTVRAGQVMDKKIVQILCGHILRFWQLYLN